MQIHRELSAKRTIGRNGKCSSADLTYLVSGVTGEANSEVLELVRSVSPDSVGNAIRKSVTLSAVRSGGVCEVDVHYAAPSGGDDRKAGDRSWSFKVSTGSRIVTAAKELVRMVSPTPGVYAPSPGTLIGWDGRFDGLSGISGAEMEIPEIYEYCVATYRSGAINASFRKRCAALVGKVNASAFHGWQAGEVLLCAVTQGDIYENRSGISLADITYSFRIRNNGSCSCGGITLQNVGGWNELWAVSRRDPLEKSIITCGVYESRLYDSGNFSALQL